MVDSSAPVESNKVVDLIKEIDRRFCHVSHPPWASMERRTIESAREVGLLEVSPGFGLQPVTTSMTIAICRVQRRLVIGNYFRVKVNRERQFGT